MFSNGYRESFQLEIPLVDTDYSAFCSLMEYFYTGEVPGPFLPSSPHSPSLPHF
jgi:hypothetical protein